MIEVAVEELERHEMAYAAGVLARGMRDNPNHVAVWGDDPRARVRGSQRLFGALLPSMKQAPLCARRSAFVVGVLGMAPPGACQPSLPSQLRLLPAMIRCGPTPTRRMLAWIREWQGRDPKERHWHLGPLAVEGGLQGMGIGSQMMERFRAQMDSGKEVAYLETDKPENVQFYEKFGFKVVDEAQVVGTPNWFMLRRPRE